MTEQILLADTIKDEMPRFIRVFKALPVDKLDYRHPNDTKGKTAMELVVTMAVEASTFPTFLTTGKIDFKEAYQNSPSTIEEAVKLLEEAFAKAISLVSSMSEEDLMSEAVMTGEGEWKTTKAKMTWALLLDLIHHRGQLSTYIRPMGGAVPSIYGPSADSKE